MSRAGSLPGQLPTPMVGSVLGPEETAHWWLHGPGSVLGPVSPEVTGAAVQQPTALPQQPVDRPAGANYVSPLLQGALSPWPSRAAVPLSNAWMQVPLHCPHAICLL